MPKLIATGSSYGALPVSEHATKAIERARAQMQTGMVGSVLLFLSGGYAHNPQAALKEAARAASCTQIFGCCANGLLTEKEWILDAEGAVAMVFPSEFCLHPLSVLNQLKQLPQLALTITTPEASIEAVNKTEIPQTGAICSDEYGHGPFSVWQSGRINHNGFVHCGLPPGIAHTTQIAHGVQKISPLQTVNKSQGHSLIEIGNVSAVQNLLDSLPENLHAIGKKQPYNILCAVSENNDIESIQNNHFKLQHIVSIDEDKGIIHMSGSIHPGRSIFWALRDESRAQIEMQSAIAKAIKEMNTLPEFAFLFPNTSRGPDFFNNTDRDLELLTESFPGLPIIGFYGNGEIAPGHQYAGLIHQYSAVFSLFSRTQE